MTMPTPASGSDSLSWVLYAIWALPQPHLRFKACGSPASISSAPQPLAWMQATNTVPDSQTQSSSIPNAPQGRSRTLVLCFDGTSDNYDATVRSTWLSFSYQIAKIAADCAEYKRCEAVLDAEAKYRRAGLLLSSESYTLTGEEILE